MLALLQTLIIFQRAKGNLLVLNQMGLESILDEESDLAFELGQKVYRIFSPCLL